MAPMRSRSPGSPPPRASERFADYVLRADARSHQSWRRDARDDLLLVEERVLTRRIGSRHGRRVCEPAARGDAEIVADECAGAADAAGTQGGKLRIPGTRREANVVAAWREVGPIELGGGIDAVVVPPVWGARRCRRARV